MKLGILFLFFGYVGIWFWSWVIYFGPHWWEFPISASAFIQCFGCLVYGVYRIFNKDY